MESPLPPSPPPILAPPPLVTPPPLAPPPAPPRSPRHRRLWLFVVLGVLGLLVVSSLIGVGHVVMKRSLWGGRVERSGGPPLQEVVLQETGAGEKIAVVDVAGVIASGWGGAGPHDLPELIRRQLERASEDRAVKAVILRVDSPGGEVLAADEIYKAIDEFQAKTGRPVVASMGSVAASGGYYVSAPCRWIVANPLTLTGSIGVIMHGYNYRGLMNKLGVRPEIYKSGKHKDMLSPDKADEDISPEERQIVRGLIDETFQHFKTVVAAGREKAQGKNQGKGRQLATNWVDYADGRVFSGRQAFDLGFVDELGNFKAAVETAKRLANVAKADLIEYQQPFEFWSLFRLLGKAEAKQVKLELGVEWPKLLPGRLYYLFLPGA